MHELIQSEIQSDMISEKVSHFQHMCVAMFHFHSVKYTRLILVEASKVKNGIVRVL